MTRPEPYCDHSNRLHGLGWLQYCAPRIPTLANYGEDNELDYLGLRAIRRRVKALEAQGERSKKGSTRSENTTSFCEIRLRATRVQQ